MTNKPYYLAYEDRYQKVFAAGADHWGHTPDDKQLRETLTAWVQQHGLKGKRVIEYACGEGASGVILSELGCIYTGVDIAPSAIGKAQAAIADYPDARAVLLDMVNERADGEYDAALDCMGIHMLLTDHDRHSYLKNACASLSPSAPMLLYKENYRDDAYEGQVESFAHWQQITGTDFETPGLRRVLDTNTEVNIPLLPARPRTKVGYMKELQEAGFIVDSIQEMDISQQIAHSATICVHKG